MTLEEFVSKINELIDYKRLSSKGCQYIFLSDIPIAADEADDILPGLVLMKLPYEVKLVTKQNNYCLKITSDVAGKEDGYFIYRYFVDNEEVYLGRTNRPAKRYMEHCRDDKRYETVNGIDIHKCKSRADMLFLERLLISTERPPWNIVDVDNGELSYNLPYIEYERYTPFELMLAYK